jgi:hypothetical protein
MSVNLTGVWNANLTNSRILGPTPRAITVTIAHSDPELQEEIVVTKLDGSEERIVFKCSTNGEPGKNLLNGRAVHGSAKWVGEELVIESRMQSGPREMHFCDYWSLSPNGQTLSMEHRNDDLAGQKTVLERAG